MGQVLTHRYSQSRRIGEGQGRHREVGSEGSPPINRDLRQSKSAERRIATEVVPMAEPDTRCGMIGTRPVG
jgi:hypothetical protein